MPLPAHGLHYGVEDRVYRAWPSISQSQLKDCPTAAHLRAKLEVYDEGYDSEALLFGRAVHAAIFEPAKYAESFRVGPCDDKRSPAWKVFAESGGQLLRASQGEAIEAMATAVRAHKAAAKLIELPGHCEVSMLWRDKETGLECKGRVDRLPHAPILLDYKTTASADKDAFAASVWEYGYDMQAAYYVDGYAAATGEKPRPFVFIAQEKEPPYAVAVWDAADWLSMGRERYGAQLKVISECRKSGVWPGYSDRVENLTVPAWVYRKWDVRYKETA